MLYTVPLQTGLAARQYNKPTSSFIFMASWAPHGGNSAVIQSATSSDDQVVMKSSWVSPPMMKDIPYSSKPYTEEADDNNTHIRMHTQQAFTN